MAHAQPISFMTANYVARQLGYRMDGPWAQGDGATQEHFRPIETYEQRLDEILRDVVALGYRAVDLWSAHLNGAWATDRHVEVARTLLDRHSLPVLSLGGGFGDTLEAFEGFCRIAQALDCPILGGRTPLLFTERERVVELLRRHGVKLAIENHPEKTVDEMLDQIGDTAGGTLGTVVDTGWYATQGLDPVEALAGLREHLLHIHLKDIRAAGAHETCRYGEGVVPIEACVRELQELGYARGISVEHEPERHDPTEDCREMLRMVEGWLGGRSGEDGGA
jgi:sugar phosphate isomerase/epimerase